MTFCTYISAPILIGLPRSAGPALHVYPLSTSNKINTNGFRNNSTSILRQCSTPHPHPTHLAAFRQTDVTALPNLQFVTAWWEILGVHWDLWPVVPTLWACIRYLTSVLSCVNVICVSAPGSLRSIGTSDWISISRAFQKFWKISLALHVHHD